MLAFYLIFTLFMLAVMAYDLKTYTIPNKLNLMILALYPIMLAFTPETVDWLGGLYAFAAVFAVGFTIFAFGIMGGGDIKLLCVLALWSGWSYHTVEFLVYMGLLGGAMSIILISARKTAPYTLGRWIGAERIPRFLSYGEPLPYGLAIASAFLIQLANGKVAGLPLTASELLQLFGIA